MKRENYEGRRETKRKGKGAKVRKWSWREGKKGVGKNLTGERRKERKRKREAERLKKACDEKRLTD